MARKAREQAPHEQQKIIWHGPSDLTFYGNRAEGHHAAMIEAQLVADGLMTEEELGKRRSNPQPVASEIVTKEERAKQSGPRPVADTAKPRKKRSRQTKPQRTHG